MAIALRHFSCFLIVIFKLTDRLFSQRSLCNCRNGYALVLDRNMCGRFYCLIATNSKHSWCDRL